MNRKIEIIIRQAELLKKNNKIIEAIDFLKKGLLSYQNNPELHSLLSNLFSTLLAIKEINLSNLGVTLDFAHILYADEQPAFSAAMVAKNSKLLGLHLNDGYGKRDDGLMVGSVHQLATMELLYQVYKDGYNGAIYFDTFPDSTDLDPVKECEANIDTVKKMLEVVKKLVADNSLSHAIANQDAVTSSQIFNKALFKKTKKKINFIQDDISISKKKVLRGIHGDYRTWKLITCLYGEFVLLVINNKKKDKEYKKSEFFYLNDKNNIQILVPPGFGNAHYVKSKKAIFHYKQSTLYNRKDQFTIKWNSKEYDLKWPFKKKPITSKRDRA